MPKKTNYEVLKTQKITGEYERPTILESKVSVMGGSCMVTVPKSIPRGTRVRVEVLWE